MNGDENIRWSRIKTMASSSSHVGYHVNFWYSNNSAEHIEITNMRRSIEIEEI